jgi:hypothetical protein
MADNDRKHQQVLSLKEIARYHEDVVSSLRTYFDDLSVQATERFFGYTRTERADELRFRIDETSLRSILVILASLEAKFRIDFELRCQRRLKDNLSRAFRAIHKEKEERVSLDQDIFEAWGSHFVESKRLIGEMRTAFRLRHWLAHGRNWQPKIGKDFDFESVFDLATAVSEEFFSDSTVLP